MPSEQPVQNETIPLTDDTTAIKIHIEAIIQALKDEDGRTKTRQLSLAVTKLEEAVFWIDDHQRRN